ncbi:hypothetical protein P154DRAFT_578056 [Amniculicola lignicola CBS 123094]|uniref:Uncharacterized protein n=1 Tax=Amniculicola lignicola CBS 123094 TaxID=1392246 RepID=A0A6A5W8H2_9PLEO|nr:hypothetical protein P154DRAFT_578056 [Amniculicola lignicola CBS 123094]
MVSTTSVKLPPAIFTVSSATTKTATTVQTEYAVQTETAEPSEYKLAFCPFPKEDTQCVSVATPSNASCHQIAAKDRAFFQIAKFVRFAYPKVSIVSTCNIFPQNETCELGSLPTRVATFGGHDINLDLSRTEIGNLENNIGGFWCAPKDLSGSA